MFSFGAVLAGGGLSSGWEWSCAGSILKQILRSSQPRDESGSRSGLSNGSERIGTSMEARCLGVYPEAKPIGFELLQGLIFSVALSPGNRQDPTSDRHLTVTGHQSPSPVTVTSHQSPSSSLRGGVYFRRRLFLSEEEPSDGLARLRLLPAANTAGGRGGGGVGGGAT